MAAEDIGTEAIANHKVLITQFITNLDRISQAMKVRAFQRSLKSDISARTIQFPWKHVDRFHFSG